MITLIGSEGSMGQRYKAILKHLGVEFCPLDKEHSLDEIVRHAMASTGVIVASPSDVHKTHLHVLKDLMVPVLCEKPIVPVVSDLNELVEVLDWYKGRRFSMMLQYAELAPVNAVGYSYYNYFRHGKDGIHWDCCQIIGLANAEVDIEETSPVWLCSLNGYRLHIGDMDKAYLTSVTKWLAGHDHSQELIYKIHERTYNYASKQKALNTRRNWNTSSKHLRAVP